MENTICEMFSDSSTYMSLVVRNNRIYSSCLYLDSGIVEERSGATWFISTLKKCIIKNIKNNKEG